MSQSARPYLCPDCHRQTHGVCVDKGGMEIYHGAKIWVSNIIVVCPCCEYVLEEDPGKAVELRDRMEDMFN